MTAPGEGTHGRHATRAVCHSPDSSTPTWTPRNFRYRPGTLDIDDIDGINADIDGICASGVRADAVDTLQDLARSARHLTGELSRGTKP
jgi:hypothetical protein